jgi:hypothetical protein|tara:strand:+ start:3495 stop:3794 length:300 start_codon:yes stop_codon:yes gene_type:complete
LREGAKNGLMTKGQSTMKRSFLSVILAFASIFSVAQSLIRVESVGDCIIVGARITDCVKNCYPTILRQTFEMKNLGYNGVVTRVMTQTIRVAPLKQSRK